MPDSNSYEKGNLNLQNFKGSGENETFDITIRESPIKKKFEQEDGTLFLEKSSFMQESPKMQV